MGVASDVSVDTVPFRGINPINIASSHNPTPSVVVVTAATQRKRAYSSHNTKCNVIEKYCDLCYWVSSTCHHAGIEVQ